MEGGQSLSNTEIQKTVLLYGNQYVIVEILAIQLGQTLEAKKQFHADVFKKKALKIVLPRMDKQIQDFIEYGRQ